ncbi:hypothetical protein IMG5_151790 [Ichthyophthirius multifiliis]|uniref:Uncharacterized protein n=1 Tax=Ichthyophthirius multifiliis TaxID=5932 RepID=G0QYS0_ICHMU|nr:hypothetical protein IMG5_151790 [Ichthyophthirius multifiliis]EGR29631.1 hypothetical protein IMG5_151790 [Ichthyophthirius multifiliis]|eukprot:XP_004030867.1 hypothetical protein IMG5_151790 [Ichthyophthirius multifiliis]
MRGEKELEPADFDKFDAFIFGGILGDHPPKDRTKELRDLNFEYRRLTEMQMTTDTAILTSKIILFDKITLNNILFVEEPEIENKNKNGQCEESCQMEGFTYVSAMYDIEKGSFSNNADKINIPIMPDKIKNELLFVDF